ncbi:MAG: hypothetical protein B9S32_13765 [Verrucomicrobia bacterium Tous-C9LFEB]|nr:MAG: hypothetical protein B9S32_13765 [Verrucomicrobia bacterium Tous-C9LFEB]
MKEDILRDHEARIEHVLRGVFQNGEAVSSDNHTPLDALIAKEESMGLDWDVRAEGINRLLDYFFVDGVHPGRVIRRVYAIAWALKRGGVERMSQTDIAALLGETRAAQSKRIRMIFNGHLAKSGFRACQAPGQKSASAVKTYSARQKGNHNRKGGKVYDTAK